jgi:hypothetical protein
MFYTKDTGKTMLPPKVINHDEISAIAYPGNRAESFNFLEKHGYLPIGLIEALSSINRSKKIKNLIKGNWFYLKEEESENPYPKGYYVLGRGGNLIPFNLYIKRYENKKDIAEKTIYIYGNKDSLKMPTLLSVNTDEITNSDGVRYIAFSFFSPDNTANFILGKFTKDINNAKEEKPRSEFEKTMEKITKLQRKLLSTRQAADPLIKEKLDQIGSIIKTMRN